MLNQKFNQAFKPEMEFHMMNIMHAALPMHSQREKTTFKCKDDFIYYETEYHYFNLEENSFGTLTWFQCLASKEKKLSSVPHTGCCIFLLLDEDL